MSSNWHRPSGQAARGPYLVEVTPEAAGWTYSGLRVLDLPAGGSRTVDTGAFETLVLPLAGGAEVSCDGQRFVLAGRRSVFEGVSDFAYLPRDASAVLSSEQGGRFALPAARCGAARLEPRYGPAGVTTVERRGAGAASRTVHNVCMPETFGAERLLVCEVLTPGGNWSSYPPHKHDKRQPGESVLEEIYYFALARPAGLAYQRVYGPGIDVLVEVRDGDVVLVPHGWHGPSMAAPGYDLYYLNVMAGPERSWRVSFDPDHAWLLSRPAPQAPPGRNDWEGP
jgi:5-deoxy-glucuronate isomerase